MSQTIESRVANVIVGLIMILILLIGFIWKENKSDHEELRKNNYRVLSSIEKDSLINTLVRRNIYLNNELEKLKKEN